MILSQNIPVKAETFVRRCTDDVMRGRYAPNPDAYHQYLERETEKRYPKVLAYLRVLDRESGGQRYSADVDHIIPRSVWRILMFGFIEPGKCGAAAGVLSNLFWRDIRWNRGEDMPLIDHIRGEAQSVRLDSRAGMAWRANKIEFFLRTKREEGLPFAGDVMDPLALDGLHAARRDSNWLNRG